MKVLLINGSPRGKGNTYIALSEVAKALEANGVETEIVSIGTKAVQGCIACNRCAESGRCVFGDALYTTVREKLRRCAVHHGPRETGNCGWHRHRFARLLCRSQRLSLRPARQAVLFIIVAAALQTGSLRSRLPGEALQDAEGLQTMRTLGNNMAWVLKSLKTGGQPVPEKEPEIMTSFIR